MGSIIALACALSWSTSVILLKRSTQEVHPYILNFTKNFFGALLMLPTVFLVEGGVTFNFNSHHLFLLAASGILGIGIADALLLKALSMVEASKLAVIECIYSPAVLILSAIIFAEFPSPSSLLGIALVLSGVFLVARSSKSLDSKEKSPVLGTVIGTTAVFLMAIGIIIVKPIFNDFPLFWIIFLRLFFGAIASYLLLFTIGDRKKAWSSLFKVTRKKELLAGCFIGTYISMILWVAGYKYQDAGITAALNQSATIFTVLFAVIFLEEKINLKTISAIGLALAGILVIIL